MPTYLVTDSASGRKFKLTGDTPPTETELGEIFGAAVAVAEPADSARAARKASLQAQQRAAVTEDEQIGTLRATDIPGAIIESLADSSVAMVQAVPNALAGFTRSATPDSRDRLPNTFRRFNAAREQSLAMPFNPDVDTVGRLMEGQQLAAQQRRARIAAPLETATGFFQGEAEGLQDQRKLIKQAGLVSPGAEATLSVDVLRGLGSTVPGVVTVLATRGQSLAPYVATALQLYQEAFDDAAANGQSFDTAHAAGVMNMPAAALERFGDVQLARGLQASLSAAAKQVKERVPAGLLARKMAIDVGQSAAGEGFTEATQTAWQDVIANDVLGYANDTPQARLQNALAAGGLGALAGGLVRAPAAGIEAWAGRRGELPDGRLVVVNDQTGGTAFPAIDPELDELPAGPAVSEAPDFSAQAVPISPVPAPNPAPSLPRELPAGPAAQATVPVNTIRPEAMMETRRAAELVLQREPAVDPDLADTMAAIRAGYVPTPEVESQKLKVERPAVESKVELPGEQLRDEAVPVNTESYQGSHRPNSEGPRAHDLLETDLAPRDIYDRPDFYTGEPGSKSFKESVAALRKIRGNPDGMVTVYRAAPVAEVKPGDWVSFSRSYSKQHGMADDPRADVPVHSFKVRARDVRWAGDSIEEFGYYPEAIRPEAGMETRRAAELGLQREPAVDPDLADTMAAIRAGYVPTQEAETSNVQRPTPTGEAGQVTITDVTPEGYGFVDKPETDAEHLARLKAERASEPIQGAEQARLQSSINEGKTILKGKLTPQRRLLVEKSVASAQAKFDALQTPAQRAARAREKMGDAGPYVPRQANRRTKTEMANAKSAEVRSAEPGERAQPPAQAQPAMHEMGEGGNNVVGLKLALEVGPVKQVEIYRREGSRQSASEYLSFEVSLKEPSEKWAEDRKLDWNDDTTYTGKIRISDHNLPDKYREPTFTIGIGSKPKFENSGQRPDYLVKDWAQAYAELPTILADYMGSQRRLAADSRLSYLDKLERPTPTGEAGPVGFNAANIEKVLGVTPEQAAPQSPLDSAIATLDQRIDELKAGRTGGLMEGVTGLPVWATRETWRAVLVVVRQTLATTKNLVTAVQAGVDYLRGLNLPGFNETQAAAALEASILADPDAQLREQARKRIAGTDTSEETKDFLRRVAGYAPESHAQWQAAAQEWLALHGNDPEQAAAAYWQARNEMHGPVWVALGLNLATELNRAERLARGQGNVAEASRLSRLNGQFTSDFIEASTEAAQTLNAYAMMRTIGQMSPFAWEVFAGRTIEKAGQAERQRLQPALDTVQDQLDGINQQGAEDVTRAPEIQTVAGRAVDAAVEAEADKAGSELSNALRLEASNTIETLPSMMRRAQAQVLAAWHKLGLAEQVRQQTGRAGQAIENAMWSAVKQRGGSQTTVSAVIAQVNRALHEQVNRVLGVTPQQFVNPATYLMKLRDALSNAEVMSRIWEQTRAAVGSNLAAIGEMERLLVRIGFEIAELEAQAKAPLEGGPEVTAKDAKLRAQQQGARDAMLAGRNANVREAIQQRRERIADVTAQLAEYRKMEPAWQTVMGMEVDVWGPTLIRGVLREQMKADGVRLQKAVSDHFRGVAGAVDPLAHLKTLTEKIVAASGLDPQAAGRLAKAVEAEFTAQVEKERAKVAKRIAEARARAKERAAKRKVEQPKRDAESIIDAFERRQTEWVKPEANRSVVRAIVRQALRAGAATSGLDEAVVRRGLQAQLEAVGVPSPVAYRLAYEVWQARQAAGGGVEAVVAGRMKSLQLDLGRLIRSHWQDVSRAGESLAEQIVGETGMGADKAEQLARAVQARFKQLVQAKKEQAIRNLAKTPGNRTLQKPDMSQRIIEASNLGALDNDTLWNAVRERLKLPAYTEEARKGVADRAERLQQLPEGSVQRQDATAQLMRFIARQQGVNLMDLGWAFWYANTLSGLLTHLVNVTSNLQNLMLNTATQMRSPTSVPQMLAGTARGFRIGMTEARAILKRGPGANRTKFTEQGQALENLDPGDFTGAGLVQQWRIVARALAAADAAFYFAAREQKAIVLARALARKEGRSGEAVAQRAREILDGSEAQRNEWGAQVDRERAQLVAMGEKPDALWTSRRLEQLRELAWDARLQEAADDYALRVTFNNRPHGLLGLVADVFKFAQNRVPAFRGVVPFVNLIANVVNESVNYTPFGFARAYSAERTGVPSVISNWSEAARKGQTALTPDAVTDLYAKAFVGTALMGAVMAQALANVDNDDGENFQLFGQGPEDANRRKALRESGWLPYSIRLGGRYYAIGNTPLAVPLGAMGNYLDAGRWDKRFDQADALNRFGVAMWGAGHVITQQSFVNGLADLLGAVERRGRSDEVGDRFLKGFTRTASSLVVPNALRQVDRLQDSTVYDAKGIEGALAASIPFARRNGEPALNAFGEPITASPWERFAKDATPGLFRELQSRGISPTIPDKLKHRTSGREMSDEEHYQYVKESGAAIKRRLQTPGMREAIRSQPEKELRQTITGIVKDERKRVQNRMNF